MRRSNAVAGLSSVAATLLGVVALSSRAPSKRVAAQAADTATEAPPGTAVTTGDSGKNDKPKRVKVLFDPARQVGVVNGEYWDPLGFSQKGKKFNFLKQREMELKHGRVAMVAFTGLVVQHFIHLPIERIDSFVTVSPNSMGAIRGFYGTTGFFGGAVILGAIIGWWELYFGPRSQGKEPGNFGDPAGFGQYTPEMRLAELQNGRLCMLGVAAGFAVELATGLDVVEQVMAPVNAVLQVLSPPSNGPEVVIPLS